ncbi:MAG: hypothetical protein N4A35_12720 [Flavobacteriales bacterium]|jgi:hypothetical protein|nr:hypothetical protein [Flavobacteriales bacterium]
MKGIGFLAIGCIFLFSCRQNYSPQEVSESYCKCAQLDPKEKTSCVKEWAEIYKGSLETPEERKLVNYNMIECNGFEGDRDFYRRLMEE